MIISAWWLRRSSKFTWKEAKLQPENLFRNREKQEWLTPKRERIRSQIKALLLLPPEWRTNMDESS